MQEYLCNISCPALNLLARFDLYHRHLVAYTDSASSVELAERLAKRSVGLT